MPLDFDETATPDVHSRVNQWLEDDLHDACSRACYALIASSRENTVPMLNLLSRACDSEGWWEGAERSAESAVFYGPEDAFAHYRVGWVRVQRNNPIAAIPMLERAVALRPTAARYETMLAYALAEADVEPHRVRALCDGAIARESSDEWAYNSAALCCLLLNEPVAAEAHVRTALRSSPECYGHWFVLAAAQRMQGRFDEALSAADHAIALLPEGSGAHAERSEALRSLGRIDDAVSSGRAAVAAAPESWEAQQALVLALDAAGMHDEAARTAREAAARSLHPRMKAIAALFDAR